MKISMNNVTKLLYAKLIILIMCLVIILRLFTLILAKYESETSADTEIDIAFYLFKEDYQTMTLNLGTVKPQNNEYVFDFNIGNQDGTNSAEIDLTYDLTIRTTTNLPLTYSLYMNQEHDAPGATNIIKTNAVAQDEDGTYFRTLTTDTQDLLYRTPKTNTYQLVVKFPLSYTDPNTNTTTSYNVEKYQDIIEAIEIKVGSRQYTSNSGGYMQNGLMLQYDGINNTGNGHSDNTSTWFDLSGNGNHGELREFDNTSNSGWKNNCLKFDGVNDGIWLGNKLSELFKSSNTIEFVVNTAEDRARDVLIGNYSASNSVNYEKSSGSLSNKARVYFNTGAFDQMSTNNVFVANTSQTFSYAMNKDNGTIELYVNGSKVHTYTSNVIKNYNANFNSAWIGRDSRTNNTPLNGTISAVRIYNRTLSAEEINSNHLEDKARFGF